MAHLIATHIRDVLELAAIERPRWASISAAITGPVADGTDLVTIEDYEARQADIVKRLTELDSEFSGRSMPEDARTEWNTLNEEREANTVTLTELRARKSTLEQLADEGSTERGAHFQTPRSGVARGNDIYDLSTVPVSLSDPTRGNTEMRDRAMRSLERATFGHPDADEARTKDQLGRLLDAVDDEDSNVDAAAVAKRMLMTGSPDYKRAFGKSLAGLPLSTSEQQALVAARALSIGSTGNYPVPYVVDPTLIPVSNGVVNPMRAIARVETITGNVWRGVTAGAIAASYDAEATQVGDDTPTLAQPELNVEKAQAFVPFSIETGQDWTGLQAELAVLFADAKDDLEGDKFINGAGHGSTEPQGLITGATTVVEGAGTATFADEDLYTLEDALPARFRARAQFVANRKIYNLARQFDTNGGAALWLRLGEGLQNTPTGNMGATLLGYPANEASAMLSALTAGNPILVLGDFRYFLIVDRIGMDVDLIPHLFGANGRPTGQRGIYAYWRNTSEVLSANAFRVLETGDGA